MKLGTIFKIRKIERNLDVIHGVKSRNCSFKICKSSDSNGEYYLFIRKKYLPLFFLLYDVKKFESYEEARAELKFVEFELKYE